MSVLTQTHDRRSSRRRALAAIGALALVLAIGIAVGRWSAPVPTTASAPPERVQVSPPAPAIQAEPARSVARSPEGAARAAATALAALADPELLRDADRRRQVVAAIARPGYRDELLPLFDRTYDYLADLLGRPAQEGDLVLRMTPLGYRVENFSPSRASVAVWQVTLLATPEREPIGAWSTSRAELVWAGEGWRVERFGGDVPGPAPAVTAPAGPSPGRLFVDAGRGFRPFAR